MKRTKAEPLHDIRADYEIAKQNGRFRRPRAGVSGVGTTGDYHFRNESKYLYHMEYSRDLDRNDTIAGMVLDRLIDNILQETGIRPDPDTGDENADAILKEKWSEWSEDESQCDLSGELSFQDMERSVLRAMFVDGDHFALPNESGSVELMEAHRCRTPTNSSKNIVFGVHLDENRKRLNYVFTKDELDLTRALRKVSDTTSIPARDEDGKRQVFHVYDPHRISQTRGVSIFHRTADAFGMHDDIQFANLVRQQVASCFTIIREQTRTAPPKGGNSGNGYGSRTTEQVSSDFSRTLENIGPGMQVQTNPGEKLTGFSPNIPNPQFFEHVQLILKIVSANLGIPLHAVLLDASQTNFSGWRGAIDQARGGFRRIQTHFVRRFHKHIYRWKVQDWIESDIRLKTLASQGGVNPFKVRWQRPTWEYIEPTKDTTADIAKKRGLITSPRRISMRRGEDYDEIVRETVQDNAKFIRSARETARVLNSEKEPNEQDITWREVLVLPLHDGLQVVLNANADSDNDDSSKTPQREGAPSDS